MGNRRYPSLVPPQPADRQRRLIAVAVAVAFVALGLALLSIGREGGLFFVVCGGASPLLTLLIWERWERRRAG